ncbi:hypothetical protein [Streptomyces phaeoluteigriseus]|nr:hypothetical protein [Streptomyces phaeoluteigriseus]
MSIDHNPMACAPYAGFHSLPGVAHSTVKVVRDPDGTRVWAPS